MRGIAGGPRLSQKTSPLFGGDAYGVFPILATDISALGSKTIALSRKPIHGRAAKVQQ